MNKYKDDLDELLNILEDTHPNLYAFITKEELHSKFDNLKDKCDNMNLQEFSVEISKILSCLKDGHTSIGFFGDALLEFRVINDKIYIIDDYKNKNSNYLYKYITKINDIDINEIIEKLRIILSYDNESWFKHLIEFQIISKSLLKKIGVVNGDTYSITLNDGTIIDYKTEKEKIYRKLPVIIDEKELENNVYYIKYGTCNNDGNIDLTEFLDKCYNKIESNDYQNIIIDLRGNTGGNSEYFSKFKNRLSKLENKNYVVLVDRGVFSSGIFAACDMLNLGAKIIGEQPGCYFNHSGYPKYFTLTNSKIDISCSHVEFHVTIGKIKSYYKKDINEENKDYFAKRYPVTLDEEIEEIIDDYINGYDPYVDRALNVLKNQLTFK